MTRRKPDPSDKKDINVNTLFPSNLLEQLDEWAWRHRMTRSAALRTLVEMAFNNDKRLQAESQQSHSEAAGVLKDAHQLQSETEKMHRDVLEALQLVKSTASQSQAMGAQILQHSKHIADIKEQLTNLEKKIAA